jgi:hypothetical protein
MSFMIPEELYFTSCTMNVIPAKAGIQAVKNKIPLTTIMVSKRDNTQVPTIISSGKSGNSG